MKKLLPVVAIVLFIQSSTLSFAEGNTPAPSPSPSPSPDKPGHGSGWGTAPSPLPEHTPLPPPPQRPIPNPQCNGDCPGRMLRGNKDIDRSSYPNEIEKTLHNGDFFKEKGYGYDYKTNYGGADSGG